MPPVAGSPGMSPRMACFGLSPTDPLLLDSVPSSVSPTRVPLGLLQPSLPACHLSHSCRVAGQKPGLHLRPCAPLSGPLVPTQDSGRIPAEPPPPQVTAHLGSGAPYLWPTVLLQLLSQGGQGPQPQWPRPCLLWSTSHLVLSTPHPHCQSRSQISEGSPMAPEFVLNPKAGFLAASGPTALEICPPQQGAETAGRTSLCCPPAPPLPQPTAVTMASSCVQPQSLALPLHGEYSGL